MTPVASSFRQTASILGFLILFSSYGNSQFVSEDPFPAVPLRIASADIYSTDSSFVVFGQIGASTNWPDAYWSGYSIPFLFTPGSSWPKAPSLLPDTNSYLNTGFGGYEEVPSYSVALDHGNHSLICWSKLHLDVSDVPPTYLSKPMLRGAIYSGGTLTDNFAADSALNPQVVFDSNNTAHMVWEKVTPLDTLPQWLHGSFIKYSSQIVYTTRSSGGAMSSPILLGKGFSPRIRIAPDNSVHIIFFGADSSTSDRFRLLYCKGSGTSLTAPKLLQTFPSMYSFRWSYVNMSVLGWSVDSSNALHYAWAASSVWPNSKYYVLHCSDEAGIRIDSSGGYLDVAIKFLFKRTGEIEAAWLSRTTVSGPTQFFFSSSADGKLFSRVRMFSSIPDAPSFSLLEDRKGNVDAIFSGTGKIQIMKDVTSGKDTLYSIPIDRTVGTSLFLDNKNVVWLLGSKDSVYSILHFPLDDIGRAPVFTFPLQRETIWQYQTYNIEQSPPWPNGYVQIRLQKDTLLANGQRYTCVPLDFLEPIYLRNEGLRTYQYSPEESSEFVRYDFSKKPGDTVAIFHHEGVTSIIQCVDEEKKELLGTLHSVIRFEGTGPYVRDEIADSLGISYYSNGLSTENVLIGAIVGGVQYGTVLNVREEPEARLGTFSLSQNYPNPFNPSTRISFSLPSKSFVSLKIFDVVGREIATVVSGVLSAGSYTKQWNAEKLSSGIYFYRLQSGSIAETKKLLLLK